VRHSVTEAVGCTVQRRAFIAANAEQSAFPCCHAGAAIAASSERACCIATQETIPLDKQVAPAPGRLHAAAQKLGPTAILDLPGKCRSAGLHAPFSYWTCSHPLSLKLLCTQIHSQPRTWPHEQLENEQMTGMAVVKVALLFNALIMVRTGQKYSH
jgi:hypothetical protein